MKLVCITHLSYQSILCQYLEVIYQTLPRETPVEKKRGRESGNWILAKALKPEPNNWLVVLNL